MLRPKTKRKRFGWGGTGRFLGSVAALMTDPPNIASLFLGGGGGLRAASATLGERLAAIGAVASREGVINAGVEAANQIPVADFQHKIGIPYTVGDQALAVGLAGLGGVVFGGGIEGLRQGYHALKSSWDAAVAAGRVTEDPETRVAGGIIEHAAHAEDIAPVPGIEGETLHREALAAWERHLVAGEPLDRAEVERFSSHRRAAILDLARRVDSGDVAAKSDAVTYGRLWTDQLDQLKSRLDIAKPEQLASAVRRIDKDGIRHALNEHGADPIPLRPDDLRHVPEVVEAGELIDVSKSHSGLPFVLWRRRVEENWLYVGEELVGSARPSLMFKTAYWTQGPQKGKAGPVEGPAPAAPARSDALVSQSPELTSNPAGDRPAGASLPPSAAKGKRLPLPPELAPPKEKPETLAAFVHRQGGVRDDEGWLAFSDVTNRAM